MSLTKLQLGPADVLWTSRAELHLGHRPPRGPHDESCCGTAAVARREAIKPGRWLNLAQVHGDRVVFVDENTEPGVEADAAVTDRRGVVLAIATADCAPIALASESLVGAVHAGWAGLYEGVVGAAVEKMRQYGATEIKAALGPCIHAGCYEFDGEALEKVIKKWGSGVQTLTSNGKTAFDLPEAVSIELKRNDVELVYSDERCTACSGEYFSYRKSKTGDRQVMLVNL